jgi:hypothetical protein
MPPADILEAELNIQSIEDDDERISRLREFNEYIIMINIVKSSLRTRINQLQVELHKNPSEFIKHELKIAKDHLVFVELKLSERCELICNEKII